MRRLALALAALFALTWSLPAAAAMDPVARGMAAQRLLRGQASACAAVALSTPCLNLTQAWSGTATFTLDFANVTADPGPSNAASLLIDRQYLGASKFNVDRSGDLRVGAGTSALPSLSFVAQTDLGFYKRTSAAINFTAGGNNVISFGQSGSAGNITVTSTGSYQFSSTTDPDAGGDVFLRRDAANTFALRNGVSPQTARVYNTFTDASNGEWGSVLWSGNELQIGSQANGTGTARSTALTSASTLYLGAGGFGNHNWSVQANGALLANTNGAQDIGALANRVQNLWAAGFVTTGYTTQSGTSYTVGANDSSIVLTAASTVTLTLPAAASFTGRTLHLKTTGGGSVISASSNVVPKAGGAAGTAILAATAGTWAELQSDGSNWIVMAGT